MKDEVRCLMYEKPPLTELMHYGVKGMHWGIRRSQRDTIRTRDRPDKSQHSILTERNVRRGKIVATGLLTGMGLIAYGEISKRVVQNQTGFDVSDQINRSIRRAVILSSIGTAGVLTKDVVKEHL